VLKDNRIESNTNFHYIQRLNQWYNNPNSEFPSFTKAEIDLFEKMKYDEILQYVENLLTTGSILSRCIKLLFVGNSQQGKTSLLYFLKEGKAIEPKPDITDGIDVGIWNIKGIDNKEIKIMTWDFAGQKVIK
jgi:Ras of Complex, Roc, domain of DAPkinase